MSDRRRRLLLVSGVAGAAVVLCLAVFVLYLFGYIHWNPPQLALITERDPHKLLAQADYLAYLGNWEKARPYFAKAEHLFAERGDQRDALYCKISCVEADVEKGSYSEAARYLSEQLKQPIVQKDPRLKLRCLTVKGIVDLNTNTLDAERDWRDALEVAKSLDDIIWENRATGWIGIVDFVNGNSAGAGAKVIGAITNAMLYHDIGAQIIFLTYLADGLTEDGMATRGLEAANRALALVRTNPDAPYPYRTYISKISALTALRRYPEARSLIATVLDHARRASVLGAEADLLREAGELEAQAGNDDRSRQYFQQTASVAALAHLPRIVGEAMFELSDLDRKAGDLQQAEQFIEKGIKAVDQVEAPYELPHYLAVEAELKAANGKYKEADTLFSQAADLVRGMLISTPTPMVEGALVAMMSEIYVEHFQLAVNALRNKDEAFQIVEGARGRAMADALHDHRQLRAEAVSDTNPAMVEITELQRQLRQQETSEERARLLDELDEAEARLAGTQYEQHEFRKLVPAAPVTLSEVQGSLTPDEVMLEYVLADPNSFCIVVTQHTETIQTLASRSQIAGAIDRYITGIVAKKPANMLAKQLYSWLLSPCIAGRTERRLIVIPDGKLNDVPFGALIDSAGRYLAQTHIVSVTPSATVLYMLRHDVHPEARYAFLGVGYETEKPAGASHNHGLASKLVDAVRGVFDLSNPNIDPLPYADEEVKSAADSLGRPTTILLDRQATEEKLKSEPLDNFDVLHFAVHGVLNTQDPDRSALLFADGPHSTEDGLWQAREIRTLSLKAQLVTLSACDTGIGKIEGEEGVDSLVGAFLMAGAKDVVASLWPANDRFTATLMEKFYDHLTQAMDDAAALNRAECDILEEYGSQTSPYYWAAFEVIGQCGSKITFQNGAAYAALKN
jgi:CHAT domain-containing protein